MSVRFERAAQRQIRRFSKTDASAVADAIERFANTSVGDVKKLKGHPPRWRLRVGRFRIVFDYEFDGIHVLAVTDRKDAYR